MRLGYTCKVLLIERADEQGAGTGFWQSVTCSLDVVDEPWQLAAQREVWEETRIDCSLPGCELTDWCVENIYDIYPQWRHPSSEVFLTRQAHRSQGQSVVRRESTCGYLKA
jgi:8-oxo-dGTP pyrophosphatase MutT (NUDIX family)